MSNKQYIQIAEVSEDEGSITKKWKSMKFLEKFVSKFFTPVINEMKDSIDRLNKENEKLRTDLGDLSNRFNQLVDQVQIDSQKTATLLADYNTKKANSDSKYKAAIDVLYSLNLKFCQNVSTFGKANKLELLEMLVRYLYNPIEAYRNAILALSQDNDKSKSILSEIENFNENFRSDLVNYLSEKNTNWEDCVKCPSDSMFNSQIMTPFNDVEIEEGTPVFIVSLGYNFPNSNSERQLPNVFKRIIE